MLPETVEHYHGLPFSISFSNVAEEDLHYHREMEMSLVLRGSVTCRIYHLDYKLNAGDIVLVDTEDIHRMYNGSEDILMLTLHADLFAYKNIYPDISYMFFACEDCTKGPEAKYQELQNKVSVLKQNMRDLITLCHENKSDDILRKHINAFVSLLVEQFREFTFEGLEFKAGQKKIPKLDMDRLYRIIRFIYENHDQKITLGSLAELEHLSPYYVSHLIKNNTGLSFQNFLNYSRVEFAEKYLLDGRYTLTQISGYCGFSSPAYFNKCFRIWHGVTPAQFKKDLRPCSRRHARDFTVSEAFALLGDFVPAVSEAYEEHIREIRIDIHASDDNGSDISDLLRRHTVRGSSSRSPVSSGYCDSAAAAFRAIISGKDISDPLFMDGLPTPYASVIRILSGMNGTAAVSDGYCLKACDKNEIRLLVCSDGSRPCTAFHFDLSGITEKVTVLRTVFSKKNSCLALPDSLKKTAAASARIAGTLENITSGISSALEISPDEPFWTEEINADSLIYIQIIA